MANNDWTKKTLKARLNAARQLLSAEFKKELLDTLRGSKTEQDYRHEVCSHNRLKWYDFFAITDYVDGVAVLAQYRIREDPNGRDRLMYHALLVQGKGVYLPNYNYPATEFCKGYVVGDDFYLSESEARRYQKKSLEEHVKKSIIVETDALHEFLANTEYSSVYNFILNEAYRVKQNAIKKIEQKKQLAAEHIINVINGLKPITKEMLLNSMVSKHMWDMKITRIKPSEGTPSVDMVKYVCSCGRQFYCPISSPEAVTCNEIAIKGFSSSIRRRRHFQNSIARMFLEYIPETEMFVWRYVRLYIDADEADPMSVRTLLTVVLTPQKLYCFGEGNYVQEPSCLDYFFQDHWNNEEDQEDEIDLIKLNDVDKYYDTSFLKYSGAKEEWKEDPQYEWSLNRKGYLYTWFNNPCVEQLKKAGFPKLAKSIERNHSLAKRVLNIRASKATEIMGLSKPFYSFAKERDASLDDMWNIKKLLAIFPNAKVEEVSFILDRLKNNSISSLKDIAEFDLSLNQIVEYIQQAETQQYLFHLDNTLELWRDVLRMAKTLNLRFRKDVKFPTYLKPQHDKLVFFTNKLAETQQEEEFKEHLDNSLGYEYSGDTEDKFLITVPKTPQELIDEGDAQSHCVASYLDSVKEGKCVIAFLRKKEDPEKSYFTIEIQDGNVIQLKGFANSLCTNSDALKFIIKWMKTKTLRKSTRDF